MNQSLSPYSTLPIDHHFSLTEKLFGFVGLAALAYAFKRKLIAVRPSPAFNNETITARFVAAIPTIMPVLNLEVAIATQTETFTQTSSKKVFWGLLDLGDNSVQIRVPVTYRYHICLREAWQLSVMGTQVSVVSPVLRVSLPPAIHTGQIERLTIRGWGRWKPEDQLQQMERQLTPALSQNAGDPRHLDLVRAACRQSIAEFVRLWLEREGQWKRDGYTTIRVQFADETGLTLEPTSRGSGLFPEPFLFSPNQPPTQRKSMALILEANYSKKIGLPGYSSHQFGLTLKVEITDPATIQPETTRLYAVLQGAVDQSLQQVGWLPEIKIINGNGHANGHCATNGNGGSDCWNCSDKQKGLIKRMIADHRLDQKNIEQLALDRFGKGLKLLNKLEASWLIDELIEVHGGKSGNQRQRYNPRPAATR